MLLKFIFQLVNQEWEVFINTFKFNFKDEYQ